MINISRTLTRRFPKSISHYAKLIGEIVWASNYTFGQFEILFCHVASPGAFQVGRSLWHSMTSDSAQLSSLKNVTVASSKINDSLKSKILWTVTVAEKLGTHRNDIVHSATIAITENGKIKIVPSDIGTRQSRSNKLREEQNLLSKFRKVRGDLLQIGQYVGCLWPFVAGFDSLPPLPHRPRLQSVQVSLGSRTQKKDSHVKKDILRRKE